VRRPSSLPSEAWDSPGQCALLLQQDGADKAVDIANKMADAFDRYPHWKNSGEFESASPSC